MTRETTKRKVLAILVGGLVLGVGAAVTLATWNDSEFAKGTFTAGSFDLEGATSEIGTYTDHVDANGAATLSFTTPLAGNMSPTDVVYAGFWVRLDSATTNNATLVASTVAATDTGGANAAQLAYTVHRIDSDVTCNGSAPTTTLVASGTDLNTLTAEASVPLTAGAGTDPGTPVQLCFAVTAGAGLVEGGETTATWSFTATSTP